MSTALLEHMQGGLTTICRCWAVRRADGTELGFTDHDRELAFDGVVFRAETALSASALVQTTGLSVDNAEALGAFSDGGISEADLLAGRYDAAEVRLWWVNWADPTERDLRFRGSLGEIRQVDGAFRAELRGLTEALNRPQGRTYQSVCSATLGDGACAVDLSQSHLTVSATLQSQREARIFKMPELAAYAPGWFERGTLQVETGAAAGLSAAIKNDRVLIDGREVELWDGLRAPIAEGDQVRLVAGCDKRAETCREKFANFLNFRGFPTIPGDDWLMSYPRRDGVNDGGSRQ